MASPYIQVARQAARQEGIDPDLFVRQIQQESGFQPHVTSRAGAEGIAQFMPGTARGLGVDPNNPTQALRGAAKLMRSYVDRFGSYRDALIAYNAGPGAVGRSSLPAETQQYVQSILGGHGAPGAGAGAGGGLAHALSGSVSPGRQSGAGFDAGAPADPSLLSALLTSQSQSLPQPVAMPPSPSSRSFLRMSVQSPVVPPVAPSSGGAAGVDNLLGALSSQQGSLPATGVSAPQTTLSGTAGTPGRTRGRVNVAANADRPGVGLTPGIMKLVGEVAGRVGHPLTIGTGTNHNRMTVDGNVSDHWSGNAADLPTSPGAQNIRLGRNALIALGMSAAEAGRAQGGIYNLPYGHGRRIQVIFNTNAGGDHHNHVHVGVSPLH